MRRTLQTRRIHYGFNDGSTGGYWIAADDGQVPFKLGQRLANIEAEHFCRGDQGELLRININSVVIVFLVTVDQHAITIVQPESTSMR